MTTCDDLRPVNCRFRLMDESKAYPRSGCMGCGKTVATGLGSKCHIGSAEGIAGETVDAMFAAARIEALTAALRAIVETDSLSSAQIIARNALKGE